MRNKIFQFLWFFIVKPFVKKGEHNKDNPVAEYHNRFMAQIKLSKLFGGFEIVLLGHSNIEAITEQYSAMSKFDRVTIGAGKGGTTATDWLVYFSTPDGQEFLKAVKDKTIVISIMGNYLLLGKMDQALEGLKGIHRLFPNSYIINEPPVRYKWLDILDGIDSGLTANQWEYGFKELNDMISSVYGTARIIDIYDFIQRLNLTAFEKVLIFRDPVHYNKHSVKAIVGFLKEWL